MKEKKKKKDLKELGTAGLEEQLQQARVEISREKGAAVSGTKTSGKIRQLKKMVARILTILNQRKRNEVKK
jgi:ribosomal protein L29